MEIEPVVVPGSAGTDPRAGLGGAPDLAPRSGAPPGASLDGRAASWEFLTSAADWSRPEIRREWRSLAARGDDLRRIYRTSEWFDHVVATAPGDRVALAVARDAGGLIRGIAPIRMVRENLEFSVAGRTFGWYSLRNAHILGGLATVPEDRPLLDSLFAAVPRALPEHDAVRVSCVEVGSFLWQYLRSAPPVRDRYLLHVLKTVGPYHVLRLPATFEDYLARYPAKKRYNLRRQARLLREHGGGRLELHRIDAEGGVPFLFEAEALMIAGRPRAAGAGAVAAPRTWSREAVLDLAGRGLLRCYVLTSGDDPVGIIQGVQLGRIYSVMDTLYRTEHAALSPGATTLFLAVDDLLRHRPVETIDFGFGEPRQRHAPTVTLDMASALLMRNTLGNRLLRRGHAAFWSSVQLAKRIRNRV